MGWSSSSGGSSTFGSPGIQVPAGGYNNSAIGFGNAPGTNTGLYWSSGGLVIMNGGNPHTILADSKASFSGAAFGYTARTSAYSATANDYMVAVDATSVAVTITLHTAVGNTGSTHVIKKTDASANAVTVATTSSQTIDASTTYSLPARWNSVTVMSDGANWLITAKV